MGRYYGEFIQALNLIADMYRSLGNMPPRWHLQRGGNPRSRQNAGGRDKTNHDAMMTNNAVMIRSRGPLANGASRRDRDGRQCCTVGGTWRRRARMLGHVDPVCIAGTVRGSPYLAPEVGRSG